MKNTNEVDFFEPNPDGLFEGEPVKIKGREIIVPALSFGQVEELTPVIARIQEPGPFTKELIADNVKVIHAALSRNYPKLTPAYVKNNLVDLKNFKVIVPAILGQSGFVQNEPGAVNTGE